MKLLLIGYGKMGHAIERVALSRGHAVLLRIDPFAPEAMGEEAWLRDDLNQADAAIEFTTPATASDNVSRLLDRHIPVVCGTTGWDIQPMQTKSRKQGTPLLWASNFSLGVNLFFALNARLNQLIRPYGYQPSITEIHHVHKLDQPSGTAKTLAAAIGNDVPIHSIREGEVPGIHSVLWDSPQDSIEIKHCAKSRDGFALGAVLAAEWLQGKTGPHTMAEVLGLDNI